MKEVSCSGNQNERCGPCRHEKPHATLARWDTKHPCTDPGFVCELTGQHVQCKECENKGGTK